MRMVIDMVASLVTRCLYTSYCSVAYGQRNLAMSTVSPPRSTMITAASVALMVSIAFVKEKLTWLTDQETFAHRTWGFRPRFPQGRAAALLSNPLRGRTPSICGVRAAL